MNRAASACLVVLPFVPMEVGVAIANSNAK
jgi:hypothetical protein